MSVDPSTRPDALSLVNQFDLESKGYHSVTFFSDTELGFSFKKDTPPDPEYVSLFQIYVNDRELKDTQVKHKPLIVRVVYGKKSESGVTHRNEDRDEWFYEPLDLLFSRDFFYDPATKFLYEGSRKITASDLLDKVYSKHIRTTKPLEGFTLRLKLRFWRRWMPRLMSKISGAFQDILFLVSGDWYVYEYFLQQESLNGKVISSRFPQRYKTSEIRTEIKEEGKEIDFFGFKVPQHPIIFYAVAHLVVWYLIKNYQIYTNSIESFLNNNFLVILYAILSFWVLDTVIPFCLKKGVKYFAIWSALSAYGEVEI